MPDLDTRPDLVQNLDTRPELGQNLDTRPELCQNLDTRPDFWPIIGLNIRPGARQNIWKQDLILIQQQAENLTIH